MQYVPADTDNCRVARHLSRQGQNTVYLVKLLQDSDVTVFLSAHRDLHEAPCGVAPLVYATLSWY